MISVELILSDPRTADAASVPGGTIVGGTGSTHASGG
jgi:hypothetical protein